MGFTFEAVLGLSLICIGSATSSINDVLAICFMVFPVFLFGFSVFVTLFSAVVVTISSTVVNSATILGVFGLILFRCIVIVLPLALSGLSL